MPALGITAGEAAVLLLGAEEVARRVAGAAMGQPLGQISAPVPLGVMRRVGLERARLQEQQLPAGTKRWFSGKGRSLAGARDCTGWRVIRKA